MSIAAIAIVFVVGLIWLLLPRGRGDEPGFNFVYVNQDGTARELSPDEQAYLSEDFAGGDGARPYIKRDYKSTDGWGSQSGFIPRRLVPTSVTILQVNPNYDVLQKAMGFDIQGASRAAGDVIEQNADGSTTYTPNRTISHEERFELSRQFMLDEQRRREALAKM